LSGEYLESAEILILRKDGDIRSALWNSANIYAEDGTTILATIAQGTDITERKRAEEKIEHLNAVLRAIRKVNQLITREKDREKLLQSACNALTKTRGYYSAWIALVDENGGFVTATQSGVGEEFSAMIDKLKSGEVPMCIHKAIGQSGIVVMADLAVECSYCPLAGICADKARFTIRREYGGRIYGFVNVTIPVAMAVDKEEQTLFEEVAGDIAFALHNIELEEERKRAEKTLIFLSTAVRMSTDSIVISDLEGKIIDVNPATLEMYGTDDKRDLIGKGSFDLIVPEDREKAFVGMAEAMEKGYTKNREYRIITKNGSTLLVEMGVAIMQDEDGKPIGFVGVSRDITERKRVEDRLRKSEEEYRSLVESTEDSVYLVDRDCRYRFTNKKHLSRLGMPKKQVIGKTYGELHSEDETKEFAKIVERVFKTGKSVSQEHRSHWGNRYVLRTLSPVKESEGIVTAVTVISKDITERKEGEEERKLLLKELEAKNTELDHFTYTVSHDLRSPLVTVQGFTDMLQKDLAQNEVEKAKDDLRFIEKAATKMDRLLRDTTTLSYRTYGKSAGGCPVWRNRPRSTGADRW
jgi:PAS domain S-box-containing protein